MDEEGGHLLDLVQKQLVCIERPFQAIEQQSTKIVSNDVCHVRIAERRLAVT
jgi:hypothetical protein